MPTPVHPPSDVAPHVPPQLTSDGPVPTRSAAPSTTPIARFLDEAAPIVATERGLTQRANLLLQSLAERIGLSEKGLEEALAKLKAQFENQSPETKAKLARFKEAVKQTLGQRQSAILTAKHERELVEQAVAKFGLEAAPASIAIREAAADVGLRFIPHDEAVRHIEELIRQRLEAHDTLPTPIVAILKKSATEWGLASDEFESLVETTTQKQTEETRLAQLRQNRFLMGVIGIVAAAALGLIGFIVLRNPRKNLADHLPRPGDPSGPTMPVGDSGTNSFWNVALVEVFDRWAREESRAESIREAFASNDVSRRTKAYEWLATAIAQRNADTTQSSNSIILWQRLYATDPDEASAAALCQASLAALSLPGPLTDVESRPAVGTRNLLDCMLAASGSKLVSPERRQTLRTSLGNALRFAPPEDQPVKEWTPQARNSLAKLWLAELSLAADSQPALAAQWALGMRSELSAGLPTDERTGLETEIGLRAATALKKDEDSAAVAKLLSDTISSRDNDTVLRVVDALDGIQSAPLVEKLQAKLLTRAGLDESSVDGDIVSAVRKKLGGKKPVSASPLVSRKARWAKLVEAHASIRERVTNDPETLLKDSAKLAWLANLGEALRRGESQAGWFDKMAGTELVTEAPSISEPVKIDGEDLLAELTPGERTLLKNYTGALSTPKDMAILKRQSYLRVVSGFSEKLKDVPAEAAQGIATYLLINKSDEEAAEVNRVLPSIRAWPRLQLALADGWKQAELAKPHLHEMWIAFTASDGTLAEVQTARPRNELRKLALRTLSEAAELGQANSAVDRAAAILAEQYAERLRLRAPTEVVAPHTSACESLSRLLPRVTGGDANESDRIVKGIELAANNDLQKLVLLQRVILAREVASLSKSRPQLTSKLAAVTESLAQRDAGAENVVRQIRDGENAMLSLLGIVYAE